MKKAIGTRIFAFAALATFTGVAGGCGHEIYRAATDSFVAPIILSPDSDMVLANKVKLDELEVERAKTVAEIEAVDAELSAGEKADKRLAEMVSAASEGLAWTKKVTQKQTSSGTLDLRALDAQRKVYVEMLAKQEIMTKQAKANMEVGLISKTDYMKEQQSLDTIRIAMIELDRTKLQSDLFMAQAQMAQSSLSNASGSPAMPEAILREYQLVQMQLEQLKLEAEMRTKKAEKRVLGEKLAKIDEVMGQLKSRPIFQAGTKSMDVAFVPYTQIEGVSKGAEVYDCIWGVVHCKPVGHVSELVPGEVILPDPWGNQARGQYAVLDLREHDSAKSKILRVRGGQLITGDNAKVSVR